MIDRDIKIGLLCLIAATALWSTAEVVVRLTVGMITPIQLATARFGLAALAMSVFLPSELRRRGLSLTRRVIADAFWASAVGVVLCALAFHYSLLTTGAAVVATIFGATPLIVMVFSAVLLKEPLTRAKSAGVVMGFVGIAVLALTKESLNFSLGGLALALISVTCFALFTVMVKKTAGPYAGLPFSALCFGLGSGVMTVFVLVEGDTATLGHARGLALPLLYLGVCTTGVSYLLYFKGLEVIDATPAASVVLLKPPMAALLAWLVLGEPLTWNLALGLVLIMGGLYLIIFTDWRRKRRAEKYSTAAGDSGKESYVHIGR